MINSKLSRLEWRRGGGRLCNCAGTLIVATVGDFEDATPGEVERTCTKCGRRRAVVIVRRIDPASIEEPALPLEEVTETTCD